MTKEIFTEEFYKEMTRIPMEHQTEIAILKNTIQDHEVKILKLETEIRQLKEALESSKLQVIKAREGMNVYEDIFDKFLDKVTG